MEYLTKENINNLIPGQDIIIKADISEVILRHSSRHLIAVPFINGVDDPHYIDIIVPRKSNLYYKRCKGSYDNVTLHWLSNMRPIEAFCMECTFADYDKFVLNKIISRYNRTLHNIQYCTGCDSMVFTTDDLIPVQCCAFDNAVRTISKKPMLDVKRHEITISGGK